MCNIFATLPFFQTRVVFAAVWRNEKKITIYEKCSKATSLQNQKSNESEKNSKNLKYLTPGQKFTTFCIAELCLPLKASAPPPDAVKLDFVSRSKSKKLTLKRQFREINVYYYSHEPRQNVHLLKVSNCFVLHVSFVADRMRFQAKKRLM